MIDIHKPTGSGSLFMGEAAVAWTASTEQALRRRVAELEQEAAAMQRRIEDMAREMAAFMDAMQRGP